MCRILSITLFYQNISNKKFQFAFNFDTKMKHLPYFRLLGAILSMFPVYHPVFRS
ncbi:hypothetical protein HMPREF3213_03228 [Heyndrickxia coagulans]|uniref:Uncharacterized protein n=1 Tax=Heyndrickxia coagulans TaxID=1398 RepID=A0A0C5CBG9_HEYCO|nr:hypothetical protein SB48_HM08orf05401 [Heyndrickxia coagulans]KWZ77798.1 hypothetical protein HMPREF3213_03228 [Heyndrickxia coagulans]